MKPKPIPTEPFMTRNTTKLDDFITAIKDKDFNGVSLFQGRSMTVTVAPDGTTTA